MNSWKEIILDFFEISVATKGYDTLNKSRKFINEKQNNLALEKDEKRRNKLIISIDERCKQLIKERADCVSTEIRNWLTATSSKKINVGERIIKTTHTTKFTHSSAHNYGLLVLDKNVAGYLNTGSLNKSPIIDLAHNNGALITISRFLALQNSEDMIFDLIIKEDFSFLDGFYKNEEQLAEWKIGFSNLVETRSINSCDKLKSIYFPIDNSLKNYHLLTPLFATSLAEELAQRRQNARYTKKPEKYTQDVYIRYPNIAIHKYGGNHPRNISMLNANRSGKGYLLSSQPPIWQSQSNHHLRQESIFDGKVLSYRVSETLSYLAEYLLRFQGINLSLSAPERKKWLARWVHDIWKEIFSYIDEIVFSYPTDWTKKEKHNLRLRYQFLLDPYCTDEDFQAKREELKWQDEIAHDFSRWLTRCIKYKAQKDNKEFSNDDWYQALWFDYASDELREHEKEIQKLSYDFEQGNV